MTSTTANPAQALEAQSIQACDLDIRADQEEAAGRHGLAKSLRRRARGHRAAATRIARREGWT